MFSFKPAFFKKKKTVASVCTNSITWYNPIKKEKNGAVSTFLQWCIHWSMSLDPRGEQHKRGSSPGLDSSANRPGGRHSWSHRWSHSLSPLLINLSDFHKPLCKPLQRTNFSPQLRKSIPKVLQPATPSFTFTSSSSPTSSSLSVTHVHTRHPIYQGKHRWADWPHKQVTLWNKQCLIQK